MNSVLKKCGGVFVLLQCLAVGMPVQAEEDVLPSRLMGLDLARDIAQGAIAACRKDGYQISVVVTDRSGDALVVMRDVFTSKYMTQLAHGKANAVVLSNLSSAEVRVNMARIKDELNLLEGVLLMEGGLPVRVAGSLIGAVGVSGAPGGDKDEACAQQGIDAVQERLDFAD
ncbi:MAG: heme-binding protein [Gammaproteobacteria bacterium]